MPLLRCIACKTGLYCAAGPDDVVGDLCPGCGSLLEPVGELAEVQINGKTRVWFAISIAPERFDGSVPAVGADIPDDRTREARLGGSGRSAPSSRSGTWSTVTEKGHIVSAYRYNVVKRSP